MTQDKSLESSLAGKYILKPIGELTPNPKNARTHPKAQIKKIAASIKEFGFVNPILIDDNGMILAGHGRLEAAKTLCLAEVPVLVFSHLSEAQRKAYTLMDNRSAEDSGWDKDLLFAEFKELDALDFDLSFTGFEAAEIDHLNFDRPNRNDIHPTMKPVALFQYQIENSSNGNGLVLDTFGGSGTTIIACEKVGRGARVCELDPKYVDVIVRRWQEFTGEKAFREGDGVKFDDLKPVKTKAA